MRQANRDYAYDIIGVRRDASPLEVKMAFRERAKETHPDINAGPEAKEEFIRLVAAYRAAEAEKMNDALTGASWIKHSKTLFRQLGKGAIVLSGLSLIVLGWIYLPLTEPQEATQESVQTGGRVADAELPANASVTTDVRTNATEPQQSPHVEPVWTTAGHASSFGSFTANRQPSFILAGAMPDLPNMLKLYASRNAQDEQPAAQSMLVPDANQTASQSTEEVSIVEPPSFVDVMPPPRPRHIGEFRGTKTASTVRKPLKSSVSNSRASTSPAAANPSTPSILDRLPKLLGF